VGIEQPDAVTVGISQIDEQHVAGAVAAGPAFDIGREAHIGGEIAHIEEVIGSGQTERGVMQPRPDAGREHDVVRVALALQEHEQELVGAVGEMYSDRQATCALAVPQLPILDQRFYAPHQHCTCDAKRNSRTRSLSSFGPMLRRI
jgi:hypothetical protein